MIHFIAIILTIIFILLSAIHFYWAFGGNWGTDAVFPKINDKIEIVMPGIIPTLIVAFGFLVFVLIILVDTKMIEFGLSEKLHNWIDYALWAMAAIFLLRAVGEFKYVGFFKKINNSKFAINDTRYYSPLCLMIGTLILIIQLS